MASNDPRTPADERPRAEERGAAEAPQGSSPNQPPVVNRRGDANVPTVAEGSLDDDSRSTPAA